MKFAANDVRLMISDEFARPFAYCAIPSTLRILCRSPFTGIFALRRKLWRPELMSKRDVLRPLAGETGAIKNTQCYDSLSEIPNAYGVSTGHISAEGICANSNLYPSQH